MSVSYNHGVPYINDPVTSGVKNPSVPGYQDLIDANPYTNAEFNSSPWQGLLKMFGIRTQADAWKENMAVQANEYNASIMQKKYDEEYNLPINQVARMRAAGLNPDINGGDSIDSGSAAPLGEDPSTPMQSVGAEGQFTEMANFVLSAFSSSLGMIETFQGIQSRKLQNTLLSIQGENEFNSFARGISGMFLPPSPQPDGMVNPFDWKGVALKNAEAFAGKHLPKKMQQKFVDWQEQFWNSAIGESESYEDFRKRISSERGYSFDSKYFWSEIQSVLDDMVTPLAENAMKLYQGSQKTELAQQGAETAESQYQQELYSNLEGETEAAARNSTNENTAAVQGSLSVVNGTIEEIMKNLKSSSKKDGITGALSSIALALISGFYLYVQSGAKVSSGSSSSEWSGKSSGSSQSGSFSLGF